MGLAFFVFSRFPSFFEVKRDEPSSSRRDRRVTVSSFLSSCSRRFHQFRHSLLLQYTIVNIAILHTTVSSLLHTTVSSSFRHSATSVLDNRQFFSSVRNAHSYLSSLYTPSLCNLLFAVTATVWFAVCIHHIQYPHSPFSSPILPTVSTRCVVVA